jgi:hypothetical protein
MRVDASRLRAVAAQFQRRSLQLTGVIALALIAIGVVAGPTKTMGAVLVSLGTALLSSVVVAAVALEREDFAQSMLDHGLQRLFENRKTAFADSYWTGLVRNVRSHYRVLGTANHGYLFDEQARKDTGESFRDAIVKRRVAVEMLWLRPDSDIARLREAEEGRRTIEDTLESIVFFWEFRESLPDDSRERFALREYDTLPSCGLTWADDQMIVTTTLQGVGIWDRRASSSDPGCDALTGSSRLSGRGPRRHHHSPTSTRGTTRKSRATDTLAPLRRIALGSSARFRQRARRTELLAKPISVMRKRARRPRDELALHALR